MPTVSVVIPTFNRGALIGRTLAALREVEPPDGDFEIIVVDDGSLPEHARMIETAVTSTPKSRLLHQENQGPAVARNAGIRVSRGTLVAFLDDDCAPAPDWLRHLTGALERKDASLGAVGGRVLPAPPTNWMSRFCAATEYSSGVQHIFENAATANACYRRGVLDQLGGFDEGFRHPGGDDPDLSARTRAAGYRLEFVPEAVVYHAEIESLRDYVLHMYRRGIGDVRLDRNQGRRLRAKLRVLLLPVFLARTGRGCWQRTRGKGSAVQRTGWVLMDTLGQTAFVSGGAWGLARGR